jgi:DNA-binding transcriptional regulator GbsR (MarR family)
LSQAQIDLFADRLPGPVTRRIFKNGWSWLGFAGLLLALCGLSYPAIRYELNKLVSEQIAKRFAEPRIRETFQEVAEKQASEMLRNEIQPAVERVLDNLQNEYQAVSEEVSRLRIQNNLHMLGDRAISQGDREAFKEITRIAQTETEMNSLKKALI